MRHWHVKDSEGVSSFVITGDLEHPRDVGYPDDAGFIAVRMLSEPGPFDTAVAGVIMRDSAALRAAQPAPLPTTRGELEALINTRFNALNSLQVPLG
jgi:hypothetical protein